MGIPIVVTVRQIPVKSLLSNEKCLDTNKSHKKAHKEKYHFRGGILEVQQNEFDDEFFFHQTF